MQHLHGSGHPEQVAERRAGAVDHLTPAGAQSARLCPYRPVHGQLGCGERTAVDELCAAAAARFLRLSKQSTPFHVGSCSLEHARFQKAGRAGYAGLLFASRRQPAVLDLRSLQWRARRSSSLHSTPTLRRAASPMGSSIVVSMGRNDLCGQRARRWSHETQFRPSGRLHEVARTRSTMALAYLANAVTAHAQRCAKSSSARPEDGLHAALRHAAAPSASPGRSAPTKRVRAAAVLEADLTSDRAEPDARESHAPRCRSSAGAESGSSLDCATASRRACREVGSRHRVEQLGRGCASHAPRS